MTETSAASPLEEAVARVGDRWTLLVVQELLAGPRRFNDLLAAIPGLASTAAGRELAGAVRLLAQWGAERSGDADGPRHLACGTPVEARWYCPTCARMVDDDESGDLRYF
jgi:DNA-binding HxlR family transcriptional regulator